MEEGIGLALEDLLTGTPLLAFLKELVMIRDGELIDHLPPAEEGEEFLDEMTPFEKRLYAWYCRREAETVQEASTFDDGTGCYVCRGCASFDDSSPCANLHALKHVLKVRRALLIESLEHRFPNVKHPVFRRGFKVYAPVHHEHVCITDSTSAILLAEGYPF